MKKQNKSPKDILYENMAKINPDFKKPMNEAFEDVMKSDNRSQYQKKVEQLKQKLDQLLGDESEWDIIDTLYRMLIYRKPKLSQSIAEHHSPEHRKKVELMKGKLDFLFQNDYYDLIEKLNKILDKLYPYDKDQEYELTEETNSELYHETLSSALEYAKEKAEKAGYEVDEDDMFTTFGTGGIGYEETKKGIISLYKNGKPARKALAIQIYRMPSGKYELNSYIN